MFTRGAAIWYRRIDRPAAPPPPRRYRRAFAAPARMVKLPGTIVWSTGYWARVRLLTATGATEHRRVRVTSLTPRLEDVRP